MPPETNYARSGDLYIAYQVSGTGPVDVVLAPHGSPGGLARRRVRADG